MSNYLQNRQRRRLLPILLLLMSLSTSLSAFARDFYYDGVYYTVIDETAKTCKTKAGYILPGTRVSGSLILPQEAYDGKSWYKLIEIGSYSFSICEDLKSVVIPDGVTYLGSDCFHSCTSLSSITIPSSVTDIGCRCFMRCTSLSSITIPSSVQSIGEECFWECTSLTSITIPSSVTYISDGCFYGCTSLSSITLPSSVQSIGEDCFRECTSLTSITIPSSVTNIGDGCFSGCTSLSSITIPSSVQSIGNRCFEGCTLKPLELEGDPSDIGSLSGMEDGSYILCWIKTKEKVTDAGFKGPIYCYDEPYRIASSTPLLCGIKINLEKNPYYIGKMDKFKLTADVINRSTEEKVVENMEFNPDNEILIKDLKPKTEYEIKFSWTPEQEDYASESIFKFKTVTPTVKCDYSATQTTITINSIKATTDETVTPKVYIKDKEYTGEKYEMKDLFPGEDYYYYVFADYNGEKFYASSLYTKDIEPQISIKENGPTSVKMSVSVDTGDAEITSSGWESTWGCFYEGKDNVIVCGLEPGTTYYNKYYVDVHSGGRDHRIYSDGISVTLPALEMEMLKPKCVSSTNAIVAAKTNIADDEPSVGFQWKKYDAPATLEPNEAYAVVCDGMLEGYIRNLQTTSFYSVRAFYKDAEGNYYFTDWTTFDPSDFSYFEPTVRTYPVEEVSSSTATVRGYALPGTDNIKSQGFQYWRSGGAAEAVAFAPASTEIVTVPVSGQVMTTTFENLDESTTYVYRAYAETDAGFTYGEEMSFTTESASGVSTLWPDSDKAEAPTIVCYYNLQGQRFSQPQPGLNIVLYSDGTTRKIMTRR